MDWNREQIKQRLLVVCGGVAFFCALQNLPAVAGALRWALGILSPFLAGGAIAFILNVPMRAIEGQLPKGKRWRSLRRPLALVLTLAAVTGVVTLAVCVVSPGIADAVRSITGQLPAAIQRVQEQLAALESWLPQLETLAADFEIDWKALSEKAIALARDWGGGLVSSGGVLMAGVVSGVSTFVIGLIFSFYVLLQKERLSRQGRQVFYALFPEPWADKALEVLRLSNRTFSSFLSGQCVEAVILGTLFVVAMTLCRMPYALLVGVLIALTALIPVVGAFIGCVVGALLIAVTNPWQAVGFVVLFLVLQQIEGNLIYPHVVGSSVGLPSIWVLAAVTLGGKLMGIAGMLFFIPLCSVLYALFRGFVKDRLKERNIPAKKWRDP
ncbi:AI-2E family transporter [uncultured Oscillibacter sp.]|uniref:AI-2E family transporter n=1 Tax=uncultured Oscillibacter sp. TaxID=876091 RepID=UPI002633ABEF|nr:AI-2E family transporter [uncultured Oscillibacter sp.]